MPSVSFETKDYGFLLPPEQIAQGPVVPRDHARLLVLRRSERSWEHRFFFDLPTLLGPSDCLVANNTRVLPARFKAQRVSTGGQFEIFLLEKKASEGAPANLWECLLKGGSRIREGLRLRLLREAAGQTSFFEAEVLGEADAAQKTFWVQFQEDPLKSGIGQVPLPPYIRRTGLSESPDDRTYQTVYAKQEGSVAAPTAGLHFTSQVLESLATKGCGWEEITLHVGLGTFRPVKVQDIRDHVLHEERFEISKEVAGRLSQWKKKPGARLIAVGTTTLRTLESAWLPETECFREGAGRTRVFFYPGGPSKVQVLDGLLTNFHLPESTLLMLVCAFVQDRQWVLAAYQEAIQKGYRFFSYGDAMLIL